MMPGDYKSTDGKTIPFDLDAVTSVCAAYSKVRRGWTATLIYVPSTKAFVELRSSPQDIRGNSQEESEEVNSGYIEETFSITAEQLHSIEASPNYWAFINRRVIA